MDKFPLKDLEARHSVRSFASQPLSEEIRNTLNAETTFVNTHEAGLNFQLVFDSDDPFRGFGRSYGLFRDARNYLACVTDPSFPNTSERAGYFAQKFVMNALARGLGSCFVGATYSRKHMDVELRVYEDIPFIVCFGYPEESATGFIAKLSARMMHRHQRTPREFFDGDDEAYSRALDLYPWLPVALKALACAPSARNRQPVRISIDNEGVLSARTISHDTFSDVDLGIGKFNFASVAPGDWEWGQGGRFWPQA